jgi:hypothetical protein
MVGVLRGYWCINEGGAGGCIYLMVRLVLLGYSLIGGGLLWNSGEWRERSGEERGGDEMR